MNNTMPTATRYTIIARLLHWTMAVMVVGILFIGVFMVTSIAHFNFLVTVHEPLGIAIFIFVLVRIGWRRTQPSRRRTPPYSPTCSAPTSSPPTCCT